MLIVLGGVKRGGRIASHSDLLCPTEVPFFSSESISQGVTRDSVDAWQRSPAPPSFVYRDSAHRSTRSSPSRGPSANGHEKAPPGEGGAMRTVRNSNARRKPCRFYHLVGSRHSELADGEKVTTVVAFSLHERKEQPDTRPCVVLTHENHRCVLIARSYP